MGLESHVNEVLIRAGLTTDGWYWSDGLNVSDKEIAQQIMEAIDNSGEFGPVRYNLTENKIEFGTYRDYFKPNRRFATYEKYLKAFKARRI